MIPLQGTNARAGDPAKEIDSERKVQRVISLALAKKIAGDRARDCKAPSFVPCDKSGQVRCKCTTCTMHPFYFYINTKTRSESPASKRCLFQATTCPKSPASQQPWCPVSFHKPQGAEWSPSFSMISTAAYKTASISKQAWTMPRESQCLTISPTST